MSTSQKCEVSNNNNKPDIHVFCLSEWASQKDAVKFKNDFTTFIKKCEEDIKSHNFAIVSFFSDDSSDGGANVLKFDTINNIKTAITSSIHEDIDGMEDFIKEFTPKIAKFAKLPANHPEKKKEVNNLLIANYSDAISCHKFFSKIESIVMDSIEVSEDDLSDLMKQGEEIIKRQKITEIED